MRAVDRFVLDTTEAACRVFQSITGRTNVWIAGQLTTLSSVVYVLWGGVYLWRRTGASWMVYGLLAAAACYGLMRTVLAAPIDDAEREAYRRAGQGLRNPRRIRDAPLRIAFLALSAVLAYPIRFVYVNLHDHALLLTYTLIVLTTALLYVLACDPVPPRTGLFTPFRTAARKFRSGVSDALPDSSPS